MICRKYTKERNLYPNHGYGKKLIAETAAMRKMGKHMNTCMQAHTSSPASGWVLPQSRLQHVSLRTWQMRHDCRYDASAGQQLRTQ
jgi:hypothetical protein